MVERNVDQEALYKELRSVALREASNIFQDPSDAEDVVQDAMESVYGVAQTISDSLQNPEGLRELAIIITVLNARRTVNFNRDRPDRPTDPSILSSIDTSHNPSAEHIVVLRDDTVRLINAINGLPITWRKIVKGLLSGRTNKELSVKVKMSEELIDPIFDRAVDRIGETIGIKQKNRNNY